MRKLHMIVTVAFLLGSMTLLCSAQDNSNPDVNASARLALTELVKRLGGAPSDAIASGTIQIEAGGRKEQGSVKVVMRGADESSEQITSEFTRTDLIFSKGLAADRSQGPEHSLQRAASEQSLITPLPFIAGLVADSENEAVIVGHESLNGADTLHIRTWKSFASQPRLNNMKAFTRKDIWIDSASGMLKRISLEQRDGQGATPGIQIDFYYSDYRNVRGYQIPFHVEKSVNGTHWAAVDLEAVAVNAGVSDDDLRLPTPSGSHK